jgi:hypothetical protein
MASPMGDLVYPGAKGATGPPGSTGPTGPGVTGAPSTPRSHSEVHSTVEENLLRLFCDLGRLERRNELLERRLAVVALFAGIGASGWLVLLILVLTDTITV